MSCMVPELANDHDMVYKVVLLYTDYDTDTITDKINAIVAFVIINIILLGILCLLSSSLCLLCLYLIYKEYKRTHPNAVGTRT